MDTFRKVYPFIACPLMVAVSVGPHLFQLSHGRIEFVLGVLDGWFTASLCGAVLILSPYFKDKQ